MNGARFERGLSIATGRLEAKLDRMLGTRRRNTANRRLARHLEHERLWLFTFLHCPGLDATNNAAQRAIRGMVIAARCGAGIGPGKERARNRSWSACCAPAGNRARTLLRVAWDCCVRRAP